MKKIKNSLLKSTHLRILSLVVLLGLYTTSVVAGSPVWKVVKSNPDTQQNQLLFYIGGTIHLLGKSDYPLPEAFQNAYHDADELVLETNIKKIQTPDFAASLMKQVVYPEGKTLQHVLKPLTYEALKNHLANRGVPISQINRFKVGMLSVTLTTIELQRMGLAGIGVDEFFANKADEDAKPMRYFESPEKQLQFIAGMGEGMEDQFISHALKDLKTLPSLLDHMKQAWRRGETEHLDDLVLKQLKRDFPAVFEVLLLNRNKAWLEQILTMAKTPEKELILVGALHLVGSDGILHQLKQLGFKVEQL